MAILSPSMLSCDFSKLIDDIRKVESLGVKYLHIDVMDGIFVPNISFGGVVISSIRDKSKMVFDTHLMITEPERYIETFVKAGADIITIHYESTKDPKSVLDLIHSYGIKAGITIKPKTPVSVLENLVDYCDMILIMSVEPGFGGQKFIPESIEKIKEVTELVKKSGRKIDIEVDGGITVDNCHAVVEAGANVIVAGSAVFGAKDIEGAVKTFLEA